ncbi:hypothetical protein PFICI_11711 [Pestalotiopsis fici W106-1]|uniref:NACHT domain-containing protein n=1 Tax=Pestalotiopsis fici (strain W106-1 / CGMCC3.15140) TaxID=1229662 RepID=W3WR59_PESFW|nr:uncharacterized protein PFICI_11711 [Pestalotiopsis fici W106-1]ETS76324.1 hypothetical protein PFICI_11711 [Pestalotiopsis fici W106-1]
MPETTASDHNVTPVSVEVEQASASGNAHQFIGNVFDNSRTQIFKSPGPPLTLWQAHYKSKANEDQDYCYDGTRSELLDNLMRKVTAPGAGDMIWLKGPAGFGKSAVAKTLCLRLDQPIPRTEGSGSSSPEFQLGGSYFFRRIDPERSNINKFIITIADQFAEKIEGFRSCIPDYNSKQLSEMNSEELFKKLIVDPSKRLSKPSIAIIVDALDECTTSVSKVLEILSNFRDLPSIRARVVFTSRPLPMLENIGEQFQLKPEFMVDLDDDGIVTESREDISLFLRKKFQGMQTPATRKGGQWPSEKDFNRAVYLATNPKPLFIYAVTMCRFVENQWADPCYMLKQWLETNQDNDSSTHVPIGNNGQLFSMYRNIFREIVDRGLHDADVQRLRLIVHSVCAITVELSTADLLRLLESADMDHDLLLLRRNMQSILDIPRGDDLDSPVKIYHKSLLDFLKQSEAEDCIFYPYNDSLSGLELGEKCLTLISELVRKERQDGLEIDKCDKKVAEFAYRKWAEFLTSYNGQLSEGSRAMHLLQDFLTCDFHTVFRVGYVNDIFDYGVGLDLVKQLPRLAETQQSPSLRANLKEATTFIMDMVRFQDGLWLFESYQSALIFGSTSHSHPQNSRFWQDPQASVQTYTLRDSTEEEALSPVSFHFSRDAAIFVGLFSDKSIRRWNRGPGEVGLRWNFSSICRCTRGFPVPSPREHETTTLSANGSVIAYNTMTGVEVWNTQSSHSRLLPHLSMSKNRFLAISEDGSRLAACYDPDKRGAARAVTWNVSDVSNPRGVPFFLSPIVNVFTSAWETLVSYFPSLTRVLPSYCISRTFEPKGDILGGIAFSPSGERLAIFSFSHQKDDDGDRILIFQTWDTATGKYALHRILGNELDSQFFDSQGIPPDMLCLNITFWGEDEIAILWEGDAFEEPVNIVEFCRLNPVHRDRTTVAVLRHDQELGNEWLKPEPFWIDNATKSIHVSQGWFRFHGNIDMGDEFVMGIIESFGLSAGNPDADRWPRLVASRDSFIANGRRHRKYLDCLAVLEHSGFSVCSQHTFAGYNKNNGDLKFVELYKGKG